MDHDISYVETYTPDEIKKVLLDLERCYDEIDFKQVLIWLRLNKQAPGTDITRIADPSLFTNPLA